jgi:hypothetical protein
MRKTLMLILFCAAGYISGAQTLLFSENFETATLPDSVNYTGTGVRGKSSVLFSEGSRSDSMRIANVGDTVVMTTESFSTTGNSFVMLYFDHICKIEFYDEAYIEVSGNNGSTWTRLTGTQYQGQGMFGIHGNKFTAASYLDWAPGAASTPLNSWWKSETFDISMLVGNAANVKIRFVMRDAWLGNQMPDNYAWFIDNIRVIGSFSELNPPVISIVPPVIQDTVYNIGPYLIRSLITDQSQIDTAYVVYQVNSGVPDTIGMVRLPADTFQAFIPFYGFGKNITYRVIAIDGSAAHNMAMSPVYHFFCKFSTGGTFVVGSGTMINSNTEYPAPYGNWFWGARHQFLIRASELHALGVPAGNIGSLAFHVATAQGTPLQGFEIKMGSTTQSNLTSNFFANLTTVYSVSSYTETTGWNTHTFQTPFAWNGTDNLVIETCFNNSSFTYNATVYQSSTPFISSLCVFNDMTGVCQEPQGWSLDTIRPNMKIEVLGVGSLALDAGVGEMVSPVGGVLANTPFPVEVRVKNFGTDTLVSATINWRVNGVLQTPFNWTGTVAKDSLSSVLHLGTLTLPLGVHQIIAWTDNPNGQPDMNTANDSTKVSFMACATQLAGVYTVGGVNSDFADPVSAVLALNQCGISAPVVFNIHPGTYTGQLTLMPVSGASSTNTVTFKAANNDSTSVVLQHNATSQGANGVIRLEGASHIILKNLKIAPLNTTFGTGIAMSNGSSGNTVTGCYITGHPGTGEGLALVITTGAGSHNNKIEGNLLESGSTSVLVKGASIAAKILTPVINRNTIADFTHQGVVCEFVQDATIEENVINSVTTLNGSRNGIELIRSSGENRVTKNRIVVSAANESIGIVIKESGGTQPNPSLIANNFISVLGSQILSYGILAEATAHAGVIHNSLYIQGPNPTFTRGITTNVTSSYITVLNNSVESNYYPTMYEGASVVRSDFNNFWSSGQLYGYFHNGFVNFTSLSALKQATLKDSSSISFIPWYTSTTDLHTFNGILNGAATPVASVPDDIDGELRDLYFPDIGADEFTPSPYDAAVLTIMTAVSACGYTNAEDVTIEIKNAGSSSITGGLTACYQIVGSTTTVCEIVPDTLLSAAILHYTFTAKANFAVDSLQIDSVFTIRAWVTLTGDLIQVNDTALAWFTSSYAPPPPSVSDTTVNYGSQVPLSAQSTWDILWYEAPVGGAPVGFGGNYFTPMLFDTTTYYIETYAPQSGCPSPRVPLTVFVINIPPVDMGVVTINAPVTGFNLTATEPVTVTLANYGTLPASGFQTGYSINGGAPVVENPPVVIPPGSTLLHTFNTPADLSVHQTYTVSAFVILNGDTIPVNDTLSRLVENKVLSYCISTATDPGYEEITNVTLFTMSNTSPANGAMYTDFTQTVTPAYISPGMTYPISISTDYPPGYSYQYPCWVKAWIDYNLDGVFDPDDELIFSSATTSQNTVSGTVLVPANIPAGPRTMRVVFVETSMAAMVQPCGTYWWGETEDYTVMVAPLIPKDAGVTTIVHPTIASTLAESDTIPLQVSVKNFGLDTIHSVDVAYVINNGIPVITSFPAINLPPGATDTVTLPAFICPPGQFSLCSYTILQGDSNVFNDQTCRNFFGIPRIDLRSYALGKPADGCDMGSDTLSICFTHVGAIPFTGQVTLHYSINGNQPVTESLNLTMNPGDSVCYTFNALVNFAVTTTDSVFQVASWVRHPDDGVFANDTINGKVTSLHTPASPVASSITVPYATMAMLTAVSPTNDTLLWFTNPTGGSFFHMGNTYTTGMLFSDTTIYVEAIGAVPFQSFKLGTGTLQNNQYSYPTPYGNYYWGNKEQYIIRADELTTMGMTAGEISSLAFDVVTPGGIPLQNFTLKMGQTSQTAATNNFITSGLTTVYTSAAYIDLPGWNEHLFQTPFQWDGISNLVVEVCFNNTSFTQNGVVRQSPTSYPSTTQYNDDQTGVCGTTNSWMTHNQRPDMQFIAGSFACSSPRVPVQVFVQPQQPCDVGVSTILQPVASVNMTSVEVITVRVNNWGSQPQTNVSVFYQVDNLPPVTETLPSPIPSNGFVVYSFTTVANLSNPGHTYRIRSWTTLGCDQTAQNDTSLKMVTHLLPVYCISKANNPSNQEITNVNVGTLNNISMATGAMYTDFTTSVNPGMFSQGVTYPMSITSSYSPGNSSQYPCWAKAWIDLNRDGVFDPVTELVFSQSTTSSGIATGNVSIPAGALSGTTRMRVVLQQTNNGANVNPCGTYNAGETEDYSVMIAPQVPCDAGVVEIVQPLQLVQAGVAHPVKIKYRNFGSSAIPPNGLSVAYRLNNGSPVIMAVPASIPSGKLDSIVLPNVVIPPGNHTLCAYTILGCDTVVTFNDQVCITVYGEVYASLPFFDDFETVNQWYKPFGTQSWQYGVPSANTINSAHSGTKAWVTNLTGDYPNNANDFLYTPKFNFQGLTGFDTVVLSFYHWSAMQTDDYGRIQYSVNGGATWANLGFVNDPLGTNWYNAQGGGNHYFSHSNSGWIYSSYKLVPNTFNGNNAVQFRFNMVSNGSGTANGWAIDDFRLSPPPAQNDVGVSAFLTPSGDTLTGSTIQQVTIEVTNYGSAPQSTVPVTLRMNGMVIASGTLTALIPPQGTATFTFNPGFVVPATSYTLCASTSLTGDAYTANDQICTFFTPLPALNDVGVTQVLEPIPDSLNRICFDHPLYPYAYDMKVRIQNFGQNQQTSIPLQYSFVSGGPVHNHTWTGVLPPGGFTDVVLPEKFRPVLGTQQVCVRTALVTDNIVSNNEACKTYLGVSCVPGIEKPTESGFALLQNRPNPAGTSTTIGFQVPEAGTVTFGVVNMMGQVLGIQRKEVFTGSHEMELDLSSYASGIYFYFIEYNGQRLTKKMVVRR